MANLGQGCLQDSARQRDSWGRSPEISSNPDRRNLSPGPRIVSWTESPGTSCPVTCRPRWNNKSGEVAAARRDLTLISFSRARDHASQIVVRRNSSLIGCIRFQNAPVLPHLPAEVLLRATSLPVVRDALQWFLRDLTPIGQQGCVPAANVLFLWP